ncbi:hypothetical protein MANES_06G016300v8 [Manihot esculenta]|nr:hypothetical protein MANES_06G016300v8 [Manihot esculenta]
MGLKMVRRSLSSQSYSELQSFYYSQTLDHFNYRPDSYQTFQQRYFINSQYWGGANTSSPIFAYLGAETDVTLNIPAIGFIDDLAARFKGLLLYMEHRYYGESIPFGSNQNSSTLGYFSSTQALADYAQLIIDVKKNLSAENCPVIAVGGSYGGMLASWFRLKYPHIVIGALASSAPILYFDDITPQDGYYVVVSQVFRNKSESCYSNITQSWSEIDRVAGESNGLATLEKIFTLCNPLNSALELKNILASMYMYSAQYDSPEENYVENVCGAIDGAPEGTDVLGRIAAGLNSSSSSCQSMSVGRSPALQDYVQEQGWSWQKCTEIVMPFGIDNNNTMFWIAPFNLSNYISNCQEAFGVTPRPHWITTEFGGRDIKSVLGNFGSNIIFSNGLRDPYSAGGVVEDISENIVAVNTERGSHCLDLYTPSVNDPDWLVAQRDKETKIIAQWITDYAKPKKN